MDYVKIDESSDELKSGILILLQPNADNSSFCLYREGRGMMLRFSEQEAENLRDALQHVVKGTRVIIPNMEKPRKVTRPTR